MKNKLRMFLRPVGMGLMSALSLIGLYISVFSVVQSPAQALNQFWQNKQMLLPLSLGFALQAGMYVWLRKSLQRPAAVPGGKASTTFGGGASSAAVLACCAPALLNLLPLLGAASPLLGLTPVIALLAQWRMPITAIGLIANIAGISVMAFALYQTRKMHRDVCNV